MTLQFQLVDLEYSVPVEQHQPQSPLVTLYGRQADGGPVTLRVHGFFPYMYLEDLPGTPVNEVRRDIDQRLARQYELDDRRRFRAHGRYVHSVQRVTRCNLYGYQQPRVFLCVRLYNPKDVPTVRDRLWKGEWGSRYPTQTYECDFLFVLRFLVDCGIRGAGWVEVTRPTNAVERSVAVERLRGIDAPGAAAPLRLLSFDIEVAGRRGVFPAADEDPVIQIANYVTVHGEPVDEAYGTSRPRSYCLFQWKPYDPALFAPEPPGAQVVVCRNEEDMLRQWVAYVAEQDPDMLTGWNINDFDLPYLIDRMKLLEVSPRLGRDARPSYYRRNEFSSKAYGRRDRCEPVVAGRVLLDMLVVVRRAHKLRSYKLDAVAAHLLNEHKVVRQQK